MDFFDPQKQRRHNIRLVIGYAILGIILALATTILLYYVRGFGLDKQGRIIQNGLVFVSSQPEKADIYLNGNKEKSKTNARLKLPSGQYLLELKRAGYHDWKRVLTVEGGDVEMFNYPLLFPLKLETANVGGYNRLPLLTTASPDGRWLLAASGQNDFDLFDMDSKEPIPQSLKLPEEILAAGSTTREWQAVEWANNNRHLILKRTYESGGRAGTEFILFDRQNPAESQNLSIAFGFNPDKIELRGQAHDQYYLFDSSSAQLFTAKLEQPTPRPYIKNVLAFTSYKDIVSYVTADGAPDKKVSLRIQKGADSPFTIRQLPQGSYLLDMSAYDGKICLAAGTNADNRVFLYGDPLGKLKNAPSEPLVPVQILKVKNPQLAVFSPSGRFVAAENGSKFAVYDAETDRGYVYDTALPLDKPQAYASWADDFRISYVSGGSITIFDFDGTNLHQLIPASPNHVPVIDRNSRYLYFVGGETLSRAPLLVPEEL